ACLAEWSGDKDLLALVCRDQHLLVFRLNWQRLWAAISEVPVTALTWRPDGRAILTGHTDGSIVYRHVEGGDIIHQVSSFHSAPLSALSWSSLHISPSSTTAAPSVNLATTAAATSTSPPLSPSSLLANLPSLSHSSSSSPAPLNHSTPSPPFPHGPYHDLTHTYLPQTPPASFLPSASSLSAAADSAADVDGARVPEDERWWMHMPAGKGRGEGGKEGGGGGGGGGEGEGGEEERSMLCVLVSVDVVGCVVVSAFGIFPLIKLDITNRMPAAGPTSEGHSGRPSGTPVKALLTSDLAHLIVVTASSSSSSSSSSREGKQLRQGEAGCELALFHTPMMRDSPWEVLAVATHGAALTGLMESVSAAAAAMHGQWEAASCQWREKVQALQRLLEENDCHSDPRSELLYMLATGAASTDFNSFFTDTLAGEAGVKRLARTIETAGNALHALLTLHLMPALEETLFRLSSLQSLAATAAAASAGATASATAAGATAGSPGTVSPFEALGLIHCMGDAGSSEADRGVDSGASGSAGGLLQRAIEEVKVAMVWSERVVRLLAVVLPQFAAFFVWLLRCIRAANEDEDEDVRPGGNSASSQALLVNTAVVADFLHHHFDRDPIKAHLQTCAPDATSPGARVPPPPMFAGITSGTHEDGDALLREVVCDLAGITNPAAVHNQGGNSLRQQMDRVQHSCEAVLSATAASFTARAVLALPSLPLPAVPTVHLLTPSQQISAQQIAAQRRTPAQAQAKHAAAAATAAMPVRAPITICCPQPSSLINSAKATSTPHHRLPPPAKCVIALPLPSSTSVSSSSSSSQVLVLRVPLSSAKHPATSRASAASAIKPGAEVTAVAGAAGVVEAAVVDVGHGMAVTDIAMYKDHHIALLLTAAAATKAGSAAAGAMQQQAGEQQQQQGRLVVCPIEGVTFTGIQLGQGDALLQHLPPSQPLPSEGLRERPLTFVRPLAPLAAS
ncbi:unnamed protein product, partial [Closterium sp. NIES-54]